MAEENLPVSSSRRKQREKVRLDATYVISKGNESDEHELPSYNRQKASKIPLKEKTTARGKNSRAASVKECVSEEASKLTIIGTRKRGTVNQESTAAENYEEKYDLTTEENFPQKRLRRRNVKGINGKGPVCEVPVVSTHISDENMVGPVETRGKKIVRKNDKNLKVQEKEEANKEGHGIRDRRNIKVTKTAKSAKVLVEHWRKAVELQKFVNTVWPNLDFIMNQQKPRRGSFEIKIVDDDGFEIEVWSGLNKGPPRKLKFIEPQELVKLMEPHLSSSSS